MANGTRTGFLAFYSQQTDNTFLAGKDRLWIKSANDLLYFSDTNNVDHLLVGGVASALDVASLGASTTLLTLAAPVSGLYRVTISVSAHTNSDTVTATITYTDAVESFATTLTPISAVALTHDSNTGTTGSTSIVRASAATNLVVTLSVTTQTTTKASVFVERLI